MHQAVKAKGETQRSLMHAMRERGGFQCTKEMQ